MRGGYGIVKIYYVFSYIKGFSGVPFGAPALPIFFINKKH